jgi:hypothetical protein
MRAILTGLSFAVLWAATANAAGAPTSSAGFACFELYEQTGSLPMLLNRCNGATWILAQTDIIGKDGKDTLSFTYEWHPVNVDPNVAVLVQPWTQKH